jgi:hypothetical protein
MTKSKKQPAGDTPKKQTVKSNGDWIEIADGVKMRTRSLDEARAENPALNYFLPVDGQTDLNGTRLSLEQLAIVRKRFGDNCTLQDIQLWLEKQNLKIERLNWLHVVKLIESEKITAEKIARVENAWQLLKAEQPGSGGGKAGDIKLRFSFNEGQAFFDNKDLGLPTGEPVDILKKLEDSFGQVVKHSDLDLQSSKSNASDSLRKQIAILRKALEKGKIPYKIQTNRGVGYTLKSH